MAYIKLSTPEQGITNGMQLTFKAPCDGEGVLGVTLDGVNYRFVNTIGEELVCCNNTFKCHSYVSIVLDTDNEKATIITNNEAYARKKVPVLEAEVQSLKDGTTPIGTAVNVSGSIGGMKLTDIFATSEGEPMSIVNNALHADRATTASTSLEVKRGATKFSFSNGEKSIALDQNSVYAIEHGRSSYILVTTHVSSPQYSSISMTDSGTYRLLYYPGISSEYSYLRVEKHNGTKFVTYDTEGDVKVLKIATFT